MGVVEEEGIVTYTIPPKVMKAIDKLYWTPTERASGVNSLLREMFDHIKKHNKHRGKPEGEDVPSDWDILCFAAEFAGAQAIVLQDEELTGIAVALCKWVYDSHYTSPGLIYGQPDRDEEDTDGTPGDVGSVSEEEEGDGGE